MEKINRMAKNDLAKKNFIVQRKLFRDQDIQARKDFEVLHLQRNNNLHINKITPIYQETIFLANSEDGIESHPRSRNSHAAFIPLAVRGQHPEHHEHGHEREGVHENNLVKHEHHDNHDRHLHNEHDEPPDGVHKLDVHPPRGGSHVTHVVKHLPSDGNPDQEPILNNPQMPSPPNVAPTGKKL